MQTINLEQIRTLKDAVQTIRELNSQGCDAYFKGMGNGQVQIVFISK